MVAAQEDDDDDATKQQRTELLLVRLKTLLSYEGVQQNGLGLESASEECLRLIVEDVERSRARSAAQGV